MAVAWVTSSILKGAEKDQIFNMCLSSPLSDGRKVAAYMANWAAWFIGGNLLSSHVATDTSKPLSERLVSGLTDVLKIGGLIFVAYRIYSLVPSFLLKKDELWKASILGVLQGLTGVLITRAIKTIFFQQQESLITHTQNIWKEFSKQHPIVSEQETILYKWQSRILDLGRKTEWLNIRMQELFQTTSTSNVGVKRSLRENGAQVYTRIQTLSAVLRPQIPLQTELQIEDLSRITPQILDLLSKIATDLKISGSETALLDLLKKKGECLIAIQRALDAIKDDKVANIISHNCSLIEQTFMQHRSYCRAGGGIISAISSYLMSKMMSSHQTSSPLLWGVLYEIIVCSLTEIFEKKVLFPKTFIESLPSPDAVAAAIVGIEEKEKEIAVLEKEEKKLIESILKAKKEMTSQASQ